MADAASMTGGDGGAAIPGCPLNEIHMPCGCPYPKLGDMRPCEHGYPGMDDEGGEDG